MLVQQILSLKAENNVLWVKPESMVRDAAQLLSDNRIGTVVVSQNGKTADGILSERDIVASLVETGAPCLDLQSQELMTANPVTCAPEDTADKVLETMTNGRFRHMPVMQNAEMIGLISIGDVVKARLSQLDMEKTALEEMVMGR